MLKKVLASLLILLLLGKQAVAEETADAGTFERLERGEKVTSDGYFIDFEGMAKLIADKKLLAATKDTECKLITEKLKIDLDVLSKEMQGKLQIQEKMYTQQLELRDTKIQYLEESKKSVVLYTSGAFITAALLSFGMFYLATQTVK